MLADSHAEVPVERLEHHVDRVLPRGRRVGLGVGTGEVRHEERPSDQAEELHGPREHADGGSDREQHRVGALERRRQQHRERREEHGRHRESPPEQHESRSACAEPLEDLGGRPPQDVGIVERGVPTRRTPR